MRHNLLRQCAVLLFIGVLLMPVLSKVLHAWEGHDWQILPGTQEQIHTTEVECFVCDYVPFNFHEDSDLNLPVQIVELVSKTPCFATQFASKLIISNPQLRGPPRFV